MAKTVAGGSGVKRTADTRKATPPPPAPQSGAGGAGGNLDLITYDYGRLAMRAFPIPEDALKDLARIGTEAAVCFSAAGGLFGFAINLHKDLAMAGSATGDVIATWGSVRTGCFVASGLFALAGLYFFATGHTKIAELKKKMTFSDGPYQAPSLWPRIGVAVVIAGILLVVFAIGYLVRL